MHGSEIWRARDKSRFSTREFEILEFLIYTYLKVNLNVGTSNLESLHRRCSDGYFCSNFVRDSDTEMGVFVG